MRLRSISLSRFALPALIFLTLIVFGQVVSFDFVDWDDTTLILGNELVKTFSPAIFWIFEPELYAPLSLFTFQIEHALVQFDPTIFHLTNLVLHLINVILVWKLLKAFQSQIANQKSLSSSPLRFSPYIPSKPNPSLGLLHARSFFGRHSRSSRFLRT